MIGCACVGTNDLERAIALYSDLLGLMGAKVFCRIDPCGNWRRVDRFA